MTQIEARPTAGPCATLSMQHNKQQQKRGESQGAELVMMLLLIANRVAVEEVCHVEDGDGAFNDQTHVL